MEQFVSPSSLRFESNLSENKQKYHQDVKLYLTATEKYVTADKIKTFIHLTCIGKQDTEINVTFEVNKGDERKFKHLRNIKSVVFQGKVLPSCDTIFCMQGGGGGGGG